MGIDEKKLGLEAHYINPKPLLEKIKGTGAEVKKPTAPEKKGVTV
jgi:hypothetical protein